MPQRKDGQAATSTSKGGQRLPADCFFWRSRSIASLEPGGSVQPDFTLAWLLLATSASKSGQKAASRLLFLDYFSGLSKILASTVGLNSMLLTTIEIVDSPFMLISSWNGTDIPSTVFQSENSTT